MTYEISTENLIANIVAYSKKQSVSFKELSDICSKIVQDIDSDVLIKLSKDSLSSIEQENKIVISLSGITVKRQFKQLLTSAYVNRTYNWVLPEDIKAQYVKTLKLLAPAKETRSILGGRRSGHVRKINSRLRTRVH